MRWQTDLLVKVNGAPKILCPPGRPTSTAALCFRRDRRLQHRDDTGSRWIQWDGASDLVFMDSSGLEGCIRRTSAGSGNLSGANREQYKHVRLFRLHRRPAIRLGRDVAGRARCMTPVGAVPGSNWFLLRATGDPLSAGTPGSLGR